MVKKLSSVLMMLLLVQMIWAQAKPGYYNSAIGKKERALKTALCDIITHNHHGVSYDGLWTSYEKTDCRADGKVWDMYSDMTNFDFHKDRAGNYQKEGDVYNREHSFPQSWFGKGSPMKSDLFHVYPTDGKVNGMRSNYPFGETEGEDYKSHNGWSKLGRCTTPGYSGTVFEPNAKYKGDFARTYFYMATRYEKQIGGWSSPMLAGNRYPAYTKWAIDMLLRWSKEDPVDAKERNRNNAVEAIQHNRNPFIDFPGLEQYIWGDKKDVAFNPADIDQNGGGGEVTPDPGVQTVADPEFSLSSGSVNLNAEVVVSCATPGATIHYSINKGEWQQHVAPLSIIVDQNMLVEAYAQVNDKKSHTVMANYMVVDQPVVGDGVYQKITTEGELEAGCRYLIVYEGESVAMAESKGDIRGYADVTISNDCIQTEVGKDGYPYALTLGRDAQGYTLHDVAGNSYLSLTSSDNKLHSLSQATAPESYWDITFSQGLAVIKNKKFDNRKICYNTGSPRFAAYKSALSPVVLYKEHSDAQTGIEGIRTDKVRVNVYTVDGRLLRRQVVKDDALQGLSQGVYIVGRNKVIVR